MKVGDLVMVTQQGSVRHGKMGVIVKAGYFIGVCFGVAGVFSYYSRDLMVMA